jgi:hypothetical protein
MTTPESALRKALEAVADADARLHLKGTKSEYAWRNFQDAADAACAAFVRCLPVSGPPDCAAAVRALAAQAGDGDAVPEATGCNCKHCVPADPAVSLRLALARTDAARRSPKFTPGMAGNEITISARDYDTIRAALATQPREQAGAGAVAWQGECAHHFVRDGDHIQHSCCQHCGKVISDALGGAK